MSLPKGNNQVLHTVGSLSAPVDGSVTPTDFKMALSSSPRSLDFCTVNIGNVREKCMETDIFEL